MDYEDSTTQSPLERILLDADAEPTKLPLSLLMDITDSFSSHLIIGSGGYALVYKVSAILSSTPTLTTVGVVDLIVKLMIILTRSNIL